MLDDDRRFYPSGRSLQHFLGSSVATGGLKSKRMMREKYRASIKRGKETGVRL